MLLRAGISHQIEPHCCNAVEGKSSTVIYVICIFVELFAFQLSLGGGSKFVNGMSGVAASAV